MIFRLPWFSKAPKPAYHDTQVLELDFLVDEFYEAMADIKDPVRNHIQAALMSCQTPKDLWFLRGKLHNLISRHHCESEANARVGRLDHKLRFFVQNHPEYSPDELPSGPMAMLH